MQSQAWKVHERDVAAFFGTHRRLRGSDFSQSDVEVFTDASTWFKKEHNYYILVECKYSSKHSIVKKYNNMVKSLGIVPEDKFLVRLQDYYIFYINDTKSFLDSILFTNDFKGWSIWEDVSKRSIKYLDNYIEQAREYSDSMQEIIPNLEKKPILPIACICKKNIKGKLVIVHYDDIMALHEMIHDNSSTKN